MTKLINLINLNKHALIVRLNVDNKSAEPDPRDVILAPSGQFARVSTTSVVVGNIDGVPVVRSIFGEMEGLPEPQDGVIYVGSMLVAQKAALMGRTDVVGPDTSPNGGAIRFPEGHPQNGNVYAVIRFQQF